MCTLTSDAISALSWKSSSTTECSSPKRRGRGRECWRRVLASVPSRQSRSCDYFCFAQLGDSSSLLDNHHNTHRTAFRVFRTVFIDCKNRTAWFEPLSQLQRYGFSLTIAQSLLTICLLAMINTTKLFKLESLISSEN
jgi:hypothetical protein